MDRQSLLHAVAPCSLLCHTCPALRDGAVSACANRLCAYFEGYYDFNDQNLPAQYRAWLGEFDAFYRRLGRYAHPECPGCRDNPSPGKGCIPGCVVSACTRERQIDFCADCPEFPCPRAAAFFDTVNPVIRRDWEEGSARLREAGLAQYFQEKKDISHYIHYKK